jgi:hypothetical protein
MGGVGVLLAWLCRAVAYRAGWSPLRGSARRRQRQTLFRYPADHGLNVPDSQLREGLRDARPWLPVAAALAKELQNYPDASFIEVSSGQEQVRIATRGGALVVDVNSPEETVHISIPLATLADLTAELNARRAEL